MELEGKDFRWCCYDIPGQRLKCVALICSLVQAAELIRLILVSSNSTKMSLRNLGDGLVDHAQLGQVRLVGVGLSAAAALLQSAPAGWRQSKPT